MPYISKEQREALLDAHLKLLAEDMLLSEIPGEINYVISKLIWTIFDRNPSYKTANTLIGVLEAVKLEFYRRKIASYEDQKIVENGDL